MWSREFASLAELNENFQRVKVLKTLISDADNLKVYLAETPDAINAWTEAGPPIFLAIASSDLAVVKVLLRAGTCPIDTYGAEGLSVLAKAFRVWQAASQTDPTPSAAGAVLMEIVEAALAKDPHYDFAQRCAATFRHVTSSGCAGG